MLSATYLQLSILATPSSVSCLPYFLIPVASELLWILLSFHLKIDFWSFIMSHYGYFSFGKPQFSCIPDSFLKAPESSPVALSSTIQVPVSVLSSNSSLLAGCSAPFCPSPPPPHCSWLFSSSCLAAARIAPGEGALGIPARQPCCSQPWCQVPQSLHQPEAAAAGL